MKVSKLLVRPSRGEYYLMRAEYDGAMPSPDPEASGFQVQVLPDLVCVQCIEEDMADGVDLIVYVMTGPPPDLGDEDDGWSAKARTRWLTSGRTVVASSDDAEIGSLIKKAGSYELLFNARLREPELTEPDECREVHELFVWPAAQ